MIEWWVADRPFPGESVSGDSYLVDCRGSGTLVAVIDGLGHGPAAAEASWSAVDYLKSHKGGTLETLVQGCHESLRRTRGVVMAVAHIDAKTETITWLGVGNIDARIIRGPLNSGGKEALLQRNGVVGYQMPALQSRTLDLQPGDVLVMATDGIATDYVTDLGTGPVPTRAANLLERHAKGTDDALVLVARYCGTEP